MKDICEKLEDATIRMSQIILLAGMINDGDALSDPLRDMLEEAADATLRDCFPGMPQALLDSREEDEAMFREEFSCWAMDANKLGFLIQFDRPVMRYSADGASASYSWGHYAQHWVYGDTLEEAIGKGVEWSGRREEVEKAKAAQPNPTATQAY
jgi:hypothetical protein